MSVFVYTSGTRSIRFLVSPPPFPPPVSVINTRLQYEYGKSTVTGRCFFRVPFFFLTLRSKRARSLFIQFSSVRPPPTSFFLARPLFVPSSLALPADYDLSLFSARLPPPGTTSKQHIFGFGTPSSALARTRTHVPVGPPTHSAVRVLFHRGPRAAAVHVQRRICCCRRLFYRLKVGGARRRTRIDKITARFEKNARFESCLPAVASSSRENAAYAPAPVVPTVSVPYSDFGLLLLVKRLRK